MVCCLLVTGRLWLPRLPVAHLVDCHKGSSAADECQSGQGGRCLSHHQSFLQWTRRRTTTTCSYPVQARQISTSLRDTAFMDENVSFMDENISRECIILWMKMWCIMDGNCSVAGTAGRRATGRTGPGVEHRNLTSLRSRNMRRCQYAGVRTSKSGSVSAGNVGRSESCVPSPSGTLRYMISYMISYNLDIIPDIIVLNHYDIMVL